jgi:hypothetical protein
LIAPPLPAPSVPNPFLKLYQLHVEIAQAALVVLPIEVMFPWLVLMDRMLRRAILVFILGHLLRLIRPRPADRGSIRLACAHRD